MKFSCDHLFFVKHNFGRWEPIDEGTRIQEIYQFGIKISETNVGRYLIQKRTCIECHFIQIKKVKA